MTSNATPTLVRSELAVPASNVRMIEKALASDADLVFLDLEDAVAVDAKVASRDNVIRALRDLDWQGKPPAFRVNGLDTPYFYRDLIDIVEATGDRVKRIVAPKVGRPEDLHTIDTLLRQIEMNLGFEIGAIRVEAQIETAAGLLAAERIASSINRLEALTFGPGDFTASIRMPATSIGSMDRWDNLYPGHRLHYPMARIVVAARAANLQVMDGPVAEFRDLEGLRKTCLLARGLGYDGKWCIHPQQVPIVNEIFAPSREEVAWARRVVDAYEMASKEGKGAISVDDRLVDAASIRMAEATLMLARQVGLIS